MTIKETSSNNRKQRKPRTTKDKLETCRKTKKQQERKQIWNLKYGIQHRHLKM